MRGLGEIRNEKSGECLDSLSHEFPGQEWGHYGCHGQGGSQIFAFTTTSGHLRPVHNLDLCLHPSFTTHLCSASFSELRWEYNEASHQLLHADSVKCLAMLTTNGRNRLGISSGTVIRGCWGYSFWDTNPRH